MDRRGLLGGLSAGAAAMALSRTLPADAQTYGQVPPLKSVTPYPLGVSATFRKLSDPVWSRLAATHFSRLTAEWEMKMEYMLQADGSLQFDRADALVRFARLNGMGVHGHNLVWYAQDGEYFQKLKNKPDVFLVAYTRYIQDVIGHFTGFIKGWDVVNEPIWNDGRGLRPCLWREVLGDDYIGLALEAAHQADPSAILFLNDYNLELTPKKRTTFLKLCEKLLKEGAPLSGIGTQTHIDSGIAPGLITAAIRDIASLGLMVHVSEVDISLREDHPVNLAEPRIHQVRVLDELLQAYHDVPDRQRYGLTMWALRDSDSWLNTPQGGKSLIPDEPVLFDGQGRAKPLTQAFVSAMK
jgi:endo-1,4-beta-xylanase